MPVFSFPAGGEEAEPGGSWSGRPVVREDLFELTDLACVDRLFPFDEVQCIFHLCLPLPGQLYGAIVDLFSAK